MANIILSCERLKTFCLRSGTRHRCPPMSRLFNRVLAVITRVIGQEKEIKSIKMGKEEVKLFLFIDDMTLYTENSEESTKKLLELIHLAKLQDTKSTQKVSCISTH